MSFTVSRRFGKYLAVLLLCCTARAEDATQALAKLASEAPNSTVSLLLQLSRHTTIAQLVELTSIYNLDEMKVTGQRLTHGREGILAFLTFSSLGTPEQQQRQAQCALKPIGYFSFPESEMKKIEEEFPGEAKPWFFTEAMVFTNAAEAYRITRELKDPILRGILYERISADRLESIRTQATKLMNKLSCE